MEILNWQRGYGKTFRAIQEAKQNNLPLIVVKKDTFKKRIKMLKYIQ